MVRQDGYYVMYRMPFSPDQSFIGSPEDFDTPSDIVRRMIVVFLELHHRVLPRIYIYPHIKPAGLPTFQVPHVVTIGFNRDGSLRSIHELRADWTI